MYWEVYWNLVNQYGFNPNLFAAWNAAGNHGNNLALQLLIDSFKMMPCDAGFVQARDAVLAADKLRTGGQNQCLIWRGFAKRGLGFSARQGSAYDPNDGTAAFNLPKGVCSARIATHPGHLSAALRPSKRTNAVLLIRNRALAGGNNLRWTLREAPNSCAKPARVSWLSEQNASGSVARGKRGLDTITFRSNSTPGIQTAKLCLSTNDPRKRVVSISIRMLTTGG
jgi:hypothetical protein